MQYTLRLHSTSFFHLLKPGVSKLLDTRCSISIVRLFTRRKKTTKKLFDQWKIYSLTGVGPVK